MRKRKKPHTQKRREEGLERRRSEEGGFMPTLPYVVDGSVVTVIETCVCKV